MNKIALWIRVRVCDLITQIAITASNTLESSVITIIFKYTLAYPKIGNSNFKCTLWTFKQQLALKCECFVEFLLFSYKRLCTTRFGIRLSIIRVFRIDKIGNNGNIGITGFTTWKKSSDKMLPPVGIEPTPFSDSKSNTILSTLTWHVLLRRSLNFCSCTTW